jgi:Protein of unknown function (DUF4235)
MRTFAYRILAFATALAGGRLARALTTKFRTRVDANLDPTAREARWVPVLTAAAIQAAIEATVRASAKRGSAAAVAKATGEWPAVEEKAATAAT